MARIPKGQVESLAELHLHLDGSLRLSTLQELLARTNRALPSDVCFQPGMGLDEALQRFALTLSVLQAPAAVARVASEICEDAAAQNVTTLEIRFAPQLHRDAPMEQIVDAALEGIAGRAGLILCGLFGEPPDVLERLVDIAAPRPGVVGIDLAGGPQSAHSWGLTSYASPFQRARRLGIGRTVHAGEGRPAQEIRDAIEVLGAQRIGHGTTLLEDPGLADLIIAKGVTIEACVTSNVHTGAIPNAEAHPLATWLDLGISVCICTDNTLFSDVLPGQEHRRVAALAGMNDDKIAHAISCGHAAHFVR